MSITHFDYDTSDELLLCRQGNGIQLMKPDSLNADNRSYLSNNIGHTTVKSILSSSSNVYFLDKQSICRRVNEATAEAVGLTSAYSAIGTSIFDVAHHAAANKVRQNDIHLLKNPGIQILDEEHISPDCLQSSQYLTFKFTWVNSDNQLIGIIGYSIQLGRLPIAETLKQFVAMGLLDSLNTQNYISGIEINGVYITKQESTILKHLIRGRTAKQIALILERSKRTVEQHIENIRNKIGARSKSELIDMVIDKFANFQ